MRDQVFASGMPLLIAGVCFVALAYLALVRRERFLGFWTAAWALLMLRYTWNMIWGSPFPSVWTGEVSAVLRLGFALSVLAGALELRGRPINGATVALGAMLIPLATRFVAWGVPPVHSGNANLMLMSVFVLLAAWHVAGADALPRFERGVTAGAIALYGILSGVLPRIGDETLEFRVILMSTWALQLLVGISMIATYFRASYETELSQQRAMGTNLTEVLSGYVSICMHCKAIQDEQARWQRLESYVADRSPTVFSHGLCDGCAATHYSGDDD